MRILYFSRSYTTHDRRFLMELAASPHEIWFLRLENDPHGYESRPLPVVIRELPPLGGGQMLTLPEQWLRLAPNLEEVLEDVKPDIVHAGPIQKCAFLAALVGVRRLLAMSWGSDILVDAERDAFWQWMTRYTLRRACILVSDCREVSEAAGRIAGVSRDRIAEFPWGIDTAAFRAGPDTLGLRKRPDWEEATVVICTRTWEPPYGVLHLLEGFRLALAENPRLRLVLVGTGSQRPQIEQFIRAHQLESVVMPVGAAPPEKLPEYLRAADVYASCSIGDGSSLSLLEAMATGLPVLVTDRPSNREWVEGREQGILVPYGATTSIAEALVALAGLSQERRLEAARRNRAVVEERADWKHNVLKLFAAYEALRPGPA